MEVLTGMQPTSLKTPELKTLSQIRRDFYLIRILFGISGVDRSTLHLKPPKLRDVDSKQLYTDHNNLQFFMKPMAGISTLARKPTSTCVCVMN